MSKPIDDLLAEVRQEIAQQRAPREKPEPDQLRESERVVVTLSGGLTYNGQHYDRGQSFRLQGMPLDDQLLRAGYLTTESLAERGQVSSENANFVRNALQPAEAEFFQARRRVAAAEEEVNRARAELEAAEAELESAQGELQRKEDKLRGILGERA